MEIKELKTLVNKLYSEYKDLAYVGTLLRDEYGLLSVRKEFNVKLASLLDTKTLPIELVSLLRSFVRLYTHNKENKRDLHNRRWYKIKCDQINKTIKYLKEQSKLAKEFRWTPELTEQILGRHSLL